MKTMTRQRAKSESVKDTATPYKKHTLYPGTLGHLGWLIERGNKTLKTGEVEMDSVLEICFAYTTDPEKLQSYKGPKAKAAIKKFGVTLTNEEFSRIQAHAEEQLMKHIKTMTAPKKKQAAARPGTRKATRPRKR